jgi:hypothetical protein
MYLGRLAITAIAMKCKRDSLNVDEVHLNQEED